MKNLFKNLMLVAVAAMAFTACQNDVDDVNAVSKGLTLTFSGTLEEDTRVAFGDYDGDAYKVVWSGDEAENTTFTAFDADGGQFGSKSVTMEVDENRAKAIFTVEWWDASYFADCDIIAYVGNGVSKYTGNFNFDDSTVQCPTDNSVDTNYFGLKGTFPYKAGEATVIDGVFEHLTAYGKVTLPEVEGVKFDSVKVVLTGASEDVVKTYNLDVTKVTTQTYFFACEPMAEVTKFSVSASNVSGDMYTYETEVLNGLSFNAGRVSNIKVKELNKLEASYSMTGFVHNSYGYSELTLFVNDDRTGEKVATFTVDYDPNITLIPAGTYKFTSLDDTYENEYFVGGFMYWYGDCYAAPFNFYDKIGMVVKHLDKGYDIAITWELNDVVGTYSYAGIIEHAYPDYVDWGYYMYNPGDAFPLATPEVSASANGNAITLSWGAVENAASYTIFKSVEVDYEREYVELATVNSDVLTYTITDLEFNTEYAFGVQANAAQGDTNYKNSNIAGVTQKTAFDYNKPDYTIELTKVVSIEGNIITLAGDNENDTVTIVFNPGLSSIVAGEYTGVTAWEYDSSYHSVPVWSSTSALEFSCVNGTNFNIAEAYLSYGYYASQGNAVISIDANNNYNIVLNVVCSEILVKYTYNGKLGGTEEPEESESSASAVLVTDTTFNGFNPYDVTFSFANGDKVVARFNTSGNQYLHLGKWQADYWQEPHYISLVKLNGDEAYISACNVAYENNAYTVTFSVFEYKNYTTINYTYTGAIVGLNAPEACDCLKEPEQPGDATLLNYTYCNNTYSNGTYYDVQFLREDGVYENNVVISFKYNGRPLAGTYTMSSGHFDAVNCKFNGTDSISNLVVEISTDRVFDATFEAGGQKYHLIYEGF